MSAELVTAIVLILVGIGVIIAFMLTLASQEKRLWTQRQADEKRKRMGVLWEAAHRRATIAPYLHLQGVTPIKVRRFKLTSEEGAKAEDIGYWWKV